MIQKKLPLKFKDPSIFNIPCMINHSRIMHVLLDLGASINVLPEEVLEDIMVAVIDLMFLIYFFILDMGETSTHNSVILLEDPS